jgi:hypothetical protein
MSDMKKSFFFILLFFLLGLIVSCNQNSNLETAQPELISIPMATQSLATSANNNDVFASPLTNITQQIIPTPISRQYQTKEPPVKLTATANVPVSTSVPTLTPEILPSFIHRVNLSPSNNEANDTSEGVSITQNGDAVAFVSFANNLVENDADGDCVSISGNPKNCADVFVKDLRLDKIMRVSVSNNGASGNNHSGIIREWGSHTSMASDKPFIVFHSDANNLVLGVTSRSTYLFDTESNQIQLISTDSINPVISTNGNFVVFQSSNPNLVDNDTNGVDDVALFNVQTGHIEQISVSTGGEQGNFASGLGYPATISDDGRFVAFVSEADNLVQNDNNNLPDIFLRDRDKQETIRISTNNTDKDLGESNGASINPTLSANGQFIVFQSDANNLVQNDTNNATDIFLYHLATGQIEIVSASWSGGLANASSGNPDISSNGRWIVFSSDADNLVPSDTNNVTDIFSYDTHTGHTIRISVNNKGEEGNHVSNSPAISGNGGKVAFVSLASNLVPSDSNERWDIFVRDIKSIWDTP